MESRCGDIECEAFDNGDVGSEEMSGPCGLNDLEGPITGNDIEQIAIISIKCNGSIV